jgi:hypothetical protein
LTDNPNDLCAQVVNVSSLAQSDFVDRIMKIDAGLTRSDAVSALEAEKQVVAGVVAEGGAVNTELFNASPSISGGFDSPDAPFAHTKRKVHIKLQPGAALRFAFAEVKTKRVAAVVTGTVVTAVTGLKTGAVNATLTPGRDANLKTAGAEADLSLYFVPASACRVRYCGEQLVRSHSHYSRAPRRRLPRTDCNAIRPRQTAQSSSYLPFDKELTVN